MIRFALVTFALPLTLASAVCAQAAPSTMEAQAAVTADAGCERHDYPSLEMTLYACDQGLTVWWFTVPGDHVPPGYVRRALVVRDGRTYMETHGYYDGTDAQQADFDRWVSRVVASLPK